MENWSRRVIRKSPRSKTTWAAVALALISLLVQVMNFVRSDLKPLLDSMKENKALMVEIRKQLEDHERRITQLEQRK